MTTETPCTHCTDHGTAILTQAEFDEWKQRRDYLTQETGLGECTAGRIALDAVLEKRNG
jgi:hypothetical protein